MSSGRTLGDQDADDDALFDSLEQETESDPSLNHLREARIQQLASDLNRARALQSEGNGTYIEIKSEKELLDITTSRKLCVVHFSKSDFNRCRIMDSHLEKVAEAHLEARIMKIDVGNASFLVTKMGIQVLPCVIGFLDGVSAVRIVGFEGLGRGVGIDSFETGALEDKLQEAGVLNDSFGGLADRRRMNGGSRRNERSDKVDDREADEGDDWD